MKQSLADVRFEGRAIASCAFGALGVCIVLLEIVMDDSSTAVDALLLLVPPAMILALVTGYTGRRRIIRGGRTEMGWGLARAGVVMGWILFALAGAVAGLLFLMVDSVDCTFGNHPCGPAVWLVVVSLAIPVAVCVIIAVQAHRSLAKGESRLEHAPV